MLAVRYWRHRKARALLMLLGIGTGVSLLAGVLLVNDAITRTYEGWVRGNVGWSDIEIKVTGQAGFSEESLKPISDLAGVGAVAPAIESRSYLFKGQDQASVTVRGVDPVAEAAMRPFSIVAGRELEPGDTKVALISHAAAVELDAGLGADVSLLTPFGLESLRVVGVFHPLGAGQSAPERALLLSLPQAQALFANGQRVITRVDVAVLGSPVGAVVRELRQALGAQAVVQRASGASEELARASAGLRAMLLLTGVLGVLAAAVLIVVHLRMMIDERSEDLRLLRVLGVAKARVRRWLLIEVGLLVAAGALPAVLLAGPLANLVLNNLPGQLLPFAATTATPRLGSSVLSVQVVAVLLASFLLTIVARYLLVRLLWWFARLLVSSRRLVPWLRLGGHLVGKRTAQAGSVAAVLALTTAGIIGIQGAAEANRRSLSQWLDRTVTWDLRVASSPATSGISVALPPGTVERLAAAPGVESVSAERRTEVSSRGGPITMIALNGFGLELGNRLQIVQAADLSGSAMWLTLREGRGVALSVPLASRLDVGVGDTLPLATGAGESEFTVVALVHDVTATTDAAYIALDNYSSLWGDQGVDSIVVRLTPGAEPMALMDAVNAPHEWTTTQVPLHVTLADAYRSELLTAAADTFRAARLMALVAFAVTLLALVTSSLAAAWQAEPELAELRTIGVATFTLVRVLVLEVLLIALVAGSAGLLLGTLLARQLTSSAAIPAIAGWIWPMDAYASVGVLLAAAACSAALVLVARQGVNLRQ